MGDRTRRRLAVFVALAAALGVGAFAVHLWLRGPSAESEVRRFLQTASVEHDVSVLSCRSVDDPEGSVSGWHSCEIRVRRGVRYTYATRQYTFSRGEYLFCFDVPRDAGIFWNSNYDAGPVYRGECFAPS